MILDLIALEDSSRVWIYQANRELSYEELDFARDKLFPFLEQWTSHNQSLCVYGNIFHRRFLGLFVDGSKSSSPSGCSIDSSVNFIKTLGAELNIDFFNRMIFAYFENEEDIITASKDEFIQLYSEGKINQETMVFDNLVETKGDFLKRWVIPLKDSWHANFVD